MHAHHVELMTTEEDAQGNSAGSPTRNDSNGALTGWDSEQLRQWRKSLSNDLPSLSLVDEALEAILRLPCAQERLEYLVQFLVTRKLVHFACISLICTNSGFAVAAIHGPGSESFPPPLPLPRTLDHTGEQIRQPFSLFAGRRVFCVEGSGWSVADVVLSERPWYYECHKGTSKPGAAQAREGAWLHQAGMKSMVALPCIHEQRVCGCVLLAMKSKRWDQLLLSRLQQMVQTITPFVAQACQDQAHNMRTEMLRRFKSSSSIASGMLDELVTLDKVLVARLLNTHLQAAKDKAQQQEITAAAAAAAQRDAQQHQQRLLPLPHQQWQPQQQQQLQSPSDITAPAQCRDMAAAQHEIVTDSQTGGPPFVRRNLRGEIRSLPEYQSLEGGTSTNNCTPASLRSSAISLPITPMHNVTGGGSSIAGAGGTEKERQMRRLHEHHQQQEHQLELAKALRSIPKNHASQTASRLSQGPRLPDAGSVQSHPDQALLDTYLLDAVSESLAPADNSAAMLSRLQGSAAYVAAQAQSEPYTQEWMSAADGSAENGAGDIMAQGFMTDGAPCFHQQQPHRHSNQPQIPYHSSVATDLGSCQHSATRSSVGWEYDSISTAQAGAFERSRHVTSAYFASVLAQQQRQSLEQLQQQRTSSSNSHGSRLGGRASLQNDHNQALVNLAASSSLFAPHVPGPPSAGNVSALSHRCLPSLPEDGS